MLFVLVDVGLLLENTAVFQSQVSDQLVALARLGHRAGILTVFRDRTVFERVVGGRLRQAGVDVILVGDAGFAGNLWNIAAELRRVTGVRRVSRAYVRGLWGAVAIALAGRRGRLPYVYDVRGSLVDEMRGAGTRPLQRTVYAALERWCIRGADHVTAVTSALAEVVMEFTPRDVPVVPCCVDSAAMMATADQAAARREVLGFSPAECVLVYSGGLSFYQQVPATLAIWRRLRAEPDLRFLLMTNETPRAAPALVGDLADFGDRLVHLSVPRDAVAVTLAAADVGFMLRDTRELNRVASPVKFPEYLSAGLAVVASPGTGDASALVTQHDVGTLVDPADIADGAAKVRALIARWRADATGYKQRARALVASHYDWRAHAGTFRHLYGAAGADTPSKP